MVYLAFMAAMLPLPFLSGGNNRPPPQTVEEATVQRIDAYVRGMLKREHIPGVSLAVVREGKLLLARGYGLANVELGTEATPDTVFELLSVSKQFTAAAVLLLEQEGKIRLDEKLSAYLADTPPAWNEVTLRHLLTHTSGIIDYTDIPPFFETIREDATPEELLRPVKARPLLFAPGTGWRYSNSNYYLLGQIIEKVSGTPFGVFLSQRIFQPLGMGATRLDDKRDIIVNRASGYHWLDDAADKAPPMISGYHGAKNLLQNAIYISPTRKWAAGALVSTVTDLARWDAALYTDRLLKPPARQQFFTPARLNTGALADYGMGNELFTMKGHHFAGHQGGGMAFNATYLRGLDDKLSVIVLTNQTSAPSKAMALHIAAFFLPDLAIEQDKPIADREPEVTRMLKRFLQDVQQGKVDASLFAPEAQDMVRFIERVGPDYLGKRGALVSLELLERQDEGSRRLYRYRSVFGGTPLQWTFTLNAAGKLLNVQPSEE